MKKFRLADVDGTVPCVAMLVTADLSLGGEGLELAELDAGGGAARDRERQGR